MLNLLLVSHRSSKAERFWKQINDLQINLQGAKQEQDKLSHECKMLVEELQKGQDEKEEFSFLLSQYETGFINV